VSAPGAVVVGTGFGCRVQVPALRAAGFEVLALVGTDRERTARRAERLGIPGALDSFEAALALDGVVAVTIATPPSTHAALAIAAAEAGKNVVCEKPFALDAPQAQRMFDAAESAGVVHLMGHEFRWAADRATAARAIAEGRIGEPRLATFFATSPLIADPGITMPAWWFDPAAGGGWLGASGSHAVDQVRAWLGEFESLSADLATIAPRAGGVDDTFSVRFRLASGVVGTLQQTSAAWGRRADTTRVTGTSGALRLERGAVVVADADGDHELPVPEDLTLPELPPSDDPRHRFTHLELGPYTRLCETLRARIDGRPDPTPVVAATFADGLASMRVLDAIRESAARDGELVRL
jgi:predicted dehydrogenase